MSTLAESLEAKVRDLTSHSSASFGNVFTQNLVQTVKKVDGGDTNFNTLYYSVDDDGVVTKVGGFNLLMDEAGDTSMTFTATNKEGEQVPLLDMSPSGIQISGALTVLGDGIDFETPSLEVTDESITLASEAVNHSDLDQGGFVLGTEASGTKTFLYQSALDTWSTNAGFNVEAGYGITVANDEVILNEAGLKIGADVSVSSTGMTLGTTSPVSITASGIELGDDISLTVSSGLNIADSVLLTSASLTIGDTSPVVLDNTGLVVGSAISLNADGLVAGDVSLDSDGLVIGSDIALSLSSGLTIGDSMSLTTESLVLGSVNPTILDDTSLQLGASVLLNQDGAFFSSTNASVFFGDSNQWKIWFDATNDTLKFDYYDTGSESYVTKMQLKPTD